MLSAKGCSIDRLFINGLSFDRIRMPRSRRRDDRCHDCGVQPGNYHHLGCDMERCPACQGQLIMCHCPSRSENGGPRIVPDQAHRIEPSVRQVGRTQCRNVAAGRRRGARGLPRTMVGRGEIHVLEHSDCAVAPC